MNISLGKSTTICINTMLFFLKYNNFVWGVIFFFNENVIFFENKTLTYHYLRKKFPLFYFIPGDSWNYMPFILVPNPAKGIATKILVIVKLNGRKYYIFRGFVWFYFEAQE